MAQIKDFISATPTVADSIPLGQGTNTRKATIDQLKTLITADVNASLSENTHDINNILTYGVITKAMPASFDRTKLSTWTESGIYLTDVSGITDLPTGWAQGRHCVVVFSVGNASYSMQLITPYQGSNATVKKMAFRNTIIDGSEWKELSNAENVADLSKQVNAQGATDANALLTTGRYYFNGGSNIPNTNGGTYSIIDVITMGNYLKQTLTYIHGSSTYVGKTFTRYYDNGTWSAWKELDIVDNDSPAITLLTGWTSVGDTYTYCKRSGKVVQLNMLITNVSATNANDYICKLDDTVKPSKIVSTSIVNRSTGAVSSGYINQSGYIYPSTTGLSANTQYSISTCYIL